MRTTFDRRGFLTASLLGAGAGLIESSASARATLPKKRVGVVATEYRRNSHADVIVSKILKGYREDGGPGPALEVVAIYMDQFPSGEMSRRLSREFGFPIVDSIDKALTLGGDSLVVDGVLSIGEHGAYPWNDKGQHLYPRRRFFDAICDTFQRVGAVAPVFNDKHPGPVWEDAKAMYDRAGDMNIPFMAGSSLPVTFRKPDVSIPLDASITGCLGVGYSGLDVYGFHTLEYLQCQVERRQGGEQGVSAVQCLPGDRFQELVDKGVIRRDLFERALKVTPHEPQPLDDADLKKLNIFVIHYRDGLVAPVLMFGGYARGISAAIEVNGEIVASLAEERTEPRYPHFAYLLKGIESMIHTGRPAYPVERTILTAGMLDRLLTSRFEKGKKRMTPELQIAYQPAAWSHAPHIDLLAHPSVSRRSSK